MEAVAKLRNCPMSPRKMRLVVDNIRGKKVVDALGILKYTNKEAAVWLEKLVLSAINNWEQKSDRRAPLTTTIFTSKQPLLIREALFIASFRRHKAVLIGCANAATTLRSLWQTV